MLRTPHISPTDTPMRIYSTDHATGKSHAGGDNGERISVGYHTAMESSCSNVDKYPRKRHRKTHAVIHRIFFINNSGWYKNENIPHHCFVSHIPINSRG